MKDTYTKPITVYKNFDQEELDSQYNNRQAVRDFPRYVERWNKDSARYRESVHCVLDEAYGEHPRNKLDIFMPKVKRGPARVVIFFHGGYWQAMDKSVFSFIAEPFTDQGFITVIPNYPLAPEAQMKDIVDGCRRSIIWLSRHIQRFGGDPGKLHLAGHSAGGHLVAMMSATDWQGLGMDEGTGIYSACSLSGLFQLEPIRLSYLNNKLGLSSDDVQQWSPLYLKPDIDIPFLAAVGSEESEEYHDQSKDFSAAWDQFGTDTEYMSVPETNHFSILDAFCDQNSKLRQRLIHMVESAYKV